MNKLSLKIEDLRIDSFTTSVAEGGRGTVQGAQFSAGGTCFCTRHECVTPSQPGYATIYNGQCIRC